MSCTIEGDSELYGLGVRLGLYLTSLATIFARILCPTRVSGLKSSFHVLAFALHVVLVKNILTGRPALLEFYIVFSLTFVFSWNLAVFYASYSGIVSRVITWAATVAEAAVYIWVVWTKRYSGLDFGSEEGEGKLAERDTEGGDCGRKARLFAVVDLTSTAITILLQVLTIILLLILLLKLPSFLGFKTPALLSHLPLYTVLSDKASTSVAEIDIQALELKHPLLRKLFEPKIPKKFKEIVATEVAGTVLLAAAMVLSGWFAEDTLRLSRVEVETDLLSTSQLLPLITGIISVLSVVSGYVEARRERMRCAVLGGPGESVAQGSAAESRDSREVSVEEARPLPLGRKTFPMSY